MEGRQESEPCRRCRGGSQGSCEGDDLAVADACCFIIARYLYHAFKVAIRRFFEAERDRSILFHQGESRVGKRGPCVRNLLLVPNQFRRNVKHAQTKLISSPPPVSSLHLSLPLTTTMSDAEDTKKSGYRVEYATSARAKCKGMSLSQLRSVHPHHSWLIVERVFRSQTVRRYSPQRIPFFTIFTHRASRVHQAPLSLRVNFGLGQ